MAGKTMPAGYTGVIEIMLYCGGKAVFVIDCHQSARLSISNNLARSGCLCCNNG